MAFRMEVVSSILVPLIPAPESPGPCPVCRRAGAGFDEWREIAYWQAMHGRAVEREGRAKVRIKELEAQVRLLNQKIFGPSSDSKSVPESAASSRPAVPERRRGQQPGRPIPPQRKHDHLPAVEEVRDLPEGERLCGCCGLPFAEFPGTEDSEILEVEVKSHRRVVRRRRYKPACSCPGNPPIVAATPAPRVFPKCRVGTSIWALVLMDKYLFQRPTHRLLAELRTFDLDLSLGTVTDGLKRLEPLFAPLYEALVERSQGLSFWHADETRWQVFVTREGKAGFRWYLWVFHGEDCVVFVLSPTRAHEVPEEHFGENAEGVLVVDRYSAYKAIGQVKNGQIVLAFCWAHVRRDFLRVEKGNPEHAAWAAEWVGRIGLLYHRNDQRVEAIEAAAPQDAPKATEQERLLHAHAEAMAKQRDEELASPDLPLAKKKVLESLKEHWSGLTVFLDRPEVPMDNNIAERAQRGPVVGRKNYYGSGSEWSGRLAAMLFSLFQTIALADLNPRLWLTAYLDACAAAGGTVPPDPERFLPWNLSDERKREWATDRKPPAADSS